jgi:hypothetical protein
MESIYRNLSRTRQYAYARLRSFSINQFPAPSYSCSHFCPPSLFPRAPTGCLRPRPALVKFSPPQDSLTSQSGSTTFYSPEKCVYWFHHWCSPSSQYASSEPRLASCTGTNRFLPGGSETNRFLPGCTGTNKSLPGSTGTNRSSKLMSSKVV